MPSVAVVMPAWNEAEGISTFLAEIAEAMDGLCIKFVVVDDCSTDETGRAAGSVSLANARVKVSRNENNQGHGPSTVTALRLGAELETDVVIAVDGDGQFSGTDMRTLVDRVLVGDVDVVEGIRHERGNPLYRRVASLGTRALVASKARAWPTDANTPLRAYRREVLRDLLTVVPSRTLTPNLVIAAATRRWKLRVAEIPVIVRDRLGESAVGTTWGARAASLPTSRFMKFCWNGATGWGQVSIPAQRPSA